MSRQTGRMFLYQTIILSSNSAELSLHIVLQDEGEGMQVRGQSLWSVRINTHTCAYTIRFTHW